MDKYREIEIGAESVSPYDSKDRNARYDGHRTTDEQDLLGI